MNPPVSPFARRPGCGGVVVPLADKRWYLRDWHAHETLEINLILRGTGQVLLADRRYPLLPGHLIWLWPGQRHVPAGWSADMRLWVVEWQPEYLARLRRGCRGDRPAPADPAHPFCRRLAAPALQRLDGVLAATAACPRPAAFNRGLEFALFALWEEYLAAEPVADCAAFHPKLAAVLGLLADPEPEWTQARLARHVGLSPYYLSDLFRRQTGLTIPDYRNRLRLQDFFRRLQAHPEIRILQHALEAGFGSYAQFYRVFTDAVGVPPREWLRSRAATPAPGKANAARLPARGRTASGQDRASYLT